MTKLQWGTKRVCDKCGARFYDLNRSPATCPMCDTVRTTGRSSKPRREAGTALVIEEAETEASVDGEEVPVDGLDDGEKDDADKDEEGDEVAQDDADKVDADKQDEADKNDADEEDEADGRGDDAEPGDDADRP